MPRELNSWLRSLVKSPRMLLMSPGVGAATTPLAKRAALRMAESFILISGRASVGRFGNEADRDDELWTRAGTDVYIRL